MVVDVITSRCHDVKSHRTWRASSLMILHDDRQSFRFMTWCIGFCPKKPYIWHHTIKFRHNKELLRDLVMSWYYVATSQRNFIHQHHQTNSENHVIYYSCLVVLLIMIIIQRLVIANCWVCNVPFLWDERVLHYHIKYMVNALKYWSEGATENAFKTMNHSFLSDSPNWPRRPSYIIFW